MIYYLQTIFPLLMSFLPVLILYSASAFLLYLPLTSQILLATAMSLPALIDPILVIVVVNDYRKTIAEFFKNKRVYSVTQ